MNKVILTFMAIGMATLFSCSNGEKDNIESNTSAETIQKEIKETEQQIEVNGVSHYVKIVGEGKPVIILHGGPGLFHNYLISSLKGLGDKYQFIFYDQRGCGKTAFPQDTSSISISNYVEDLEAIRNELKLEKPNVLGHSWGSIIALEYAKKYPQGIDKIVLCSPAPINEKYFDQMFRNMQKKRSDEDTKELIKLMSSKEFEDREPTTFKKAIMLGDKANLMDQNTIEDLYKEVSFNVDNANNLLLINSMLENDFMNLNFKQGLSAINNPVLIISGELDNVPFASTQELSENLGNARIEIINKSCHYPFFENNKKFNYALNSFLSPEYE